MGGGGNIFAALEEIRLIIRLLLFLSTLFER
jgi:hypothetical protein